MVIYVSDTTKEFYSYDNNEENFRINIYRNGGSISFKKNRIEDLYQILCWYQKAPQDIREMFIYDSESFRLDDFLGRTCFGIKVGNDLSSNYILIRHINMIKKCLEKVIDKLPSTDIEFKVEKLENIDPLTLRFLTLCIDKKKFKIKDGNIILRL